MRQYCTLGSVRGQPGNWLFYLDYTHLDADMDGVHKTKANGILKTNLLAKLKELVAFICFLNSVTIFIHEKLHIVLLLKSEFF